jgi:alkylation response protein AidB-like acyl-CoA dehydrogenase
MDLVCRGHLGCGIVTNAIPASKTGFATTAPIAVLETPSAAAERLALLAQKLSPRAEEERRLAPELVDELALAGLFRLCVPSAVGGAEASPVTLVESIETLARGDASAAWCVAVSATSGLLLAYLPEDAAARVFTRPETVLGGVFAPRGRARPEGDGFRVSGRWPFASNSAHCDWLMGGCVVETAEGELAIRDGGVPDIRLVLAPAADVVIHDTWHVTGLRGTGSNDMEFAELLIPPEHTGSVFTEQPVQPGPLYLFPLFGLLSLAIAAVTLGNARGALDAFAVLAAEKTPTGSRRLLGERATVHAEVGRAEASLRAARALLHDEVSRAWTIALERGVLAVPERLSLRLAATHAAMTAAEVCEMVYRLGGGSAIYESSPLQRRFRDAHVATQHMLVGPATWELTGRLLLGLESDTSQL